jgi:hypothetical protein
MTLTRIPVNVEKLSLAAMQQSFAGQTMSTYIVVNSRMVLPIPLPADKMTRGF